MTSSPGRWLVTCGYLAWALCVMYVVGCLVAPSMFTETSCELMPGSSLFGEATRSWLPPGTTCSYDLSGVHDLVISPPPERLVFVAMAFGGLPLLRYLGQLLKRPVLVEA